MISRLVNMRYEVLERVGQGTFFQVFKARDKVTGRIVAVKTLQPAYAQDPAFCSALRKNLADITSLTHPNIARLEEVGDDDGTPYLVSEYVRGINLKERIRRIAPFTLSVAVDFAIAIAEALQQAHAQGIVHGDLRPHNVIVSPEGTLKVTDFGLARVLATSQEAVAGNLGRAVAYQAPELALAQSPTVASDLYALGIILFEMLTGGLPYSGETPLNTALKHQNDPVPSPRTLNPGVPRSLEGIVMKALLKRPTDRYRSAPDMLCDLKSVRDALRFGKPLSWSPLEGEGGAVIVESPRGRESLPPTPNPTRAAETEPVGAARMSATTVSDDRISPFLKAALAGVFFVLMVAVIGLVAFWMAIVAKVPEQKFPELRGMKIEDARRAATAANVRLLEHEEFKENVAPGVIYQIDPPIAGRTIRPGHTINVWVSKGSRMVYVPDLGNLSKDEAQAKLTDAGLTLGAVNRENNDKIPFDYIISQNPRARKRVHRDVAVNLTISDGPKPDDQNPPPDTTNGGDATGAPEGDRTTIDGNSGTTDNGIPANGGIGTDDTTKRDDEMHRVKLTKVIPRDGLGRRRVRIEYEDARGTHQPIDELHDEGDAVTLKVDVYGPKITVRVFYNDDLTPVSERTQIVAKSQ